MPQFPKSRSEVYPVGLVFEEDVVALGRFWERCVNAGSIRIDLRRRAWCPGPQLGSTNLAKVPPRLHILDFSRRNFCLCLNISYSLRGIAAKTKEVECTPSEYSGLIL